MAGHELVAAMEGKKLVPTVCPYCAMGCGFYLVVEDGVATGLEYMTENPVCSGRLCAKGNAAVDVLNHPDRLRHPIKKTDGGWVQISWDEAIRITAEKILATCTHASPGSMGFLASAKCTNEENYLFQKLARLIGTNNIDHCARLCHAPTIAGLERAFGSGAMTNPISDLAVSDCIFIIGSNLAETHTPALSWIWEARNRGASVIVADPRRTPTSWAANMHLPLIPGSDVALLNGMARVIITEGLTDRAFIVNRTTGYSEFASSVMDSTPENVSNLTGLPADQIISAARTLGRAARACIVYCMGITQHTVGSDNVAACANLVLLTGNIGRPGAGLLPLRGQNNVQGACDMGALPHVLPGYEPVVDTASRHRYAQAWQSKDLPADPGLTVVEMMNAAVNGKIRTMWIMGEDPLNSDPNTNHVHAALNALDFLVVQDIFLTETARMADLVLPAAAWAEKSGTFTSTERRVQWFDQAVSPPGEAMADLWIISEVGRRLGLNPRKTDAPLILSEINDAIPAYGGVTRKRAAEPGGVVWPCPGPERPGASILYQDRFSSPDGKGRFHPVRYRPPPETESELYPLLLSTGRLAVHYNTGSMSRRTESLQARSPVSHIEMHPEDAGSLSINSGERVKIVTARGEFTTRAKITNTVKRGIVFLPFHSRGVNRLTSDALDSESKIPGYKISSCRVEKASANEKTRLCRF